MTLAQMVVATQNLYTICQSLENRGDYMVTYYNALDSEPLVAEYRMWAQLWIQTLQTYIPLINEAERGFSETFPVLAKDLITPLKSLVKILPQVYEEAYDLLDFVNQLTPALILYKEIMNESPDEFLSEVDTGGWYPEATSQLTALCTDVILEVAQVQIMLREGLELANK